MSQLTHVFVLVPEGREVPVPAGEASAAGGELLRCLPGKTYKVPWTTYTRKRVNSGDFLLSNQFGTKQSTPEAARADASIKVDHDGTVSKDQRTDDEINALAAKAAAAPATDTKGKV